MLSDQLNLECTESSETEEESQSILTPPETDSKLGTLYMYSFRSGLYINFFF